MDAVYNLLRIVVRGFYDIKAVIITDALLMHHVLSDRELVTATGVPAKVVRATCARLREDHIIKEVQRKEAGMSGGRAYTQTVYYIHFTEAIDAIKWKIHAIETKLKEELDHNSSAQEYKCSTCSSTFEVLEALTHFDPETQQFLCANCNSPLSEVETKKDAVENPNDNQMEELMVQLRPLIVELKKIDEVTIPDNTLDSELVQQVPLYDDDLSSNYASLFSSQASQQSIRDEDKGSGLTIAGSTNSKLPQQMQSTFQVNITSEAEQRSLQESNLAEKQRLAKENVLPDWHTHSTVSTDISTANRTNADDKNAQQNQPTDIKIGKDEVAENAMDEYFKKLQSEQQDDDDDDGEEDEFEDLV